MKEIWTNDPLQIQQEFRDLISSGASIFLSKDNLAPQGVYARGLTARNNILLLHLDKDQPFDAPHDQCFFFYRPTEFVTRGFYGKPLEETTSTISLLVPHEILQIQRRRYPRLETPESSTVKITPPAAQNLEKGVVLDVSVGGALLCGPFSSYWAPGIIIEGLDFLLCMKNPRLAPIEVKISRATVIRAIAAEGGEKKLAIQFEPNGKWKDDLENYIDLRIMETRFIAR